MTRGYSRAIARLRDPCRADADYSPGGDVERDVLQHLTQMHPKWLYRSHIAAACGLSQAKLENVLWRLAQRGDVQVRKDNEGINFVWRAR